ncbi:DHHW family protein [uncultured Oscillibacter sp.]|uniref:DHHW family protein n=1 Tax=uncultured Oscillibacter sp. TaxID=876091 RepID=UPI00262448A0|nr:DHHW family protein [uncultured Oscillibacter sp.]
MTTRYSRFLSAFFCVFLGGLLVWHLLLSDRDRSDVENRTLAQFPEFSWEDLKDGSFTKGVEEYFADQFPLRDQWTGLKARTEQVLGKREFNGVYLCGDALIAKVEPPKDGLEEKNLSYVSRLAESAEVPVYLGLIPSAAEIWRDRLPRGAESWDQAAFIARGLELEGVEPIDFLTALRDHAGERTWEGIFYRTDHHWTTLGAYYGYAALMEALGRGGEVPEPEAVKARDLPVSNGFQGTLYSQSGIHWLEPDSIEFWVEESGLTVTSWRDGTPKEAGLYDYDYLGKKDKYSAFLGGNQPLCVVKNPEGEGKLLVIRDSYADSLAPFLALHFEEVHLLDPRYYRYSAAKYAEDNGLDAIAVVYSVPNFITDRNLVLLTQS